MLALLAFSFAELTDIFVVFFWFSWVCEAKRGFAAALKVQHFKLWEFYFSSWGD